MVLTSHWAKLDVITTQIHKAVYRDRRDDDQEDVDVVFSDEVQRRDDAILTRPKVRAKFNTAMCTTYACVGDEIAFPCSRLPSLHQSRIEGWIAEDVAQAQDPDMHMV